MDLLHHEIVRSIVFHLAEEVKIKHNFDRNRQKAGDDWLKSFLSRNPDLTVRKSEGVSVNRALGMNREIIKKFNIFYVILYARMFNKY